MNHTGYTSFKTPLRYPGGKGRITQFVRMLLRRNALSGGTYVEPYAGGAAVALSLLYGEFVSNIHINDFDPAVFSFWKSAVDEPDALAKRIRDTKPTLWQWRKQKRIYELGRKDADQTGTLDLGFATFFLNRTNRSGIITGGPIGGFGQLSEWKVNARYNAPELAKRVLQVGANASRVAVTNLDASALLKELVPRLPARSLVYLDPPYYEKGASKLYASFYSKADHAVVALQVRKLECPWIVSYDDAPEIHKLYRGFRRMRYNLSYSANERRRGGEVMFFADSLQVPLVESPECVDSRMARELERGTVRQLGERTRSVPRELLKVG